ncbi:MAG: hypothetical protein ACP5G7_09195 [Anaerolineae bacterium]
MARWSWCGGTRRDPLPQVRDEALFAENPYASAFSIRKAERLPGYEPTHRWQDYPTWEQP